MERCPTCHYSLPNEREALGARCPRCRQPLYEPVGRMARPAREEEACCAVHPGMESVGPCSRCLQMMCETCRTMWRGQLCCAACVDRALAGAEGAPEQVRAHSRQAQAAVLFSASAWFLAALALLAGRPLAARSGPAGGPVLASAVLVVVLANVLLAAVGAGAGLAALRRAGPRGPVAVAGLALGGLYAGAVLGLGLFYLWQS